MATYSVTTAKHATLTASTVDTVNVSNSAAFITVINRATSGDPIYFTIGDASTTPDPVAAADDTYIVAAGMTLILPGDSTNRQIKLISDSAQAYSVQVI